MTSARPFRRWILPVLALAVVSVAWSAAPTQDGPDLHDLMRGVKKSLRTLGDALKDPAADAQALDALAEMEVLLLASKGHDPSNLAEVPRGDRDGHRAAYRADMARTLITTLELEIALLEGRRDAAAEMLRGPLLQQRNDGHDKYQPADG